MAKTRSKFDNKKEQDPDNIIKLAKKRFTEKDLLPFSPKTQNQTKLVQTYYENTPLIIASGYAGVGKTYLSMNLAMNEVLAAGGRDRLIIVRSAVQAREIGFTKGDINEKEEPYEQVYRGIMSDITCYNDPYENMKSLGYVEFYTTTFLRGTTFDNAIILIDEAQNFDYDELATVITRAGQNTRVVICGDSRQDDLKRNRGKQMSGLHRLLQVVKNMPYDYSEVINFTVDDIVRSGLVKEFIIADMDTPL